MTFALLATMGATWCFTSPLLGAPDEGAHVIKAAAVARGQLRGADVRVENFLSTRVVVPDVFRGASPPCFAFSPEQPASCAEPIAGTGELGAATTSAGTYNPLYYALVGWPSRLAVSSLGIYLMRLVSAAICAALLASAFESARMAGSPRLLVVGLSVAITPMVLYLAGSVNPNGIEISAAIGVWVSLAALLAGRGGAAAMGRLVTRITVAGVLLVTVRSLGPLWLGLAGMFTVAMSSRERIRQVVTDRRAWGGTALLVVAIGASLAWIVFGRALAQTPGAPKGKGLGPDLMESFSRTDRFVTEMIGRFGWLDTQPPAVTVYAWLFAVAALVLLALSADRRGAVVLLSTLVVTVVLPPLLEAPRAQEQGFPWQGRYTLPLAVGIPILAGLILDRCRALAEPALLAAVGRLATVVAVLVAVGHVAAHAWTMRRYVTGIRGELNYLVAPGWQPPFGAAWLLAATVAAATSYSVWILHLWRTQPVPVPELAGPAPLG